MLLDTCALLWLARGSDRFSPSTAAEIRRAPLVYVSAITGFEIGVKHGAGKLKLPVPPRDWFAGIVEHHDLSVIPLDLEICIKATELPPVHRDPCDRFIIASAVVHGLPVVTGDPRFREYGVDVLV